MSLQVAGVQYVLDTVIYALLADPNRKFAYAEMVCDSPLRKRYRFISMDYFDLRVCFLCLLSPIESDPFTHVTSALAANLHG